MRRHLPLSVLSALLLYAAPTLAQSFEGLDSPSKATASRGSKKKKKHRKKTSRSTSTRTTTTSTTDSVLPPVPVKTTSATPAPTVAPAPPAAAGLGLDVSPVKPLPAPKKTAPTMSFEAVDLSGKSGDRQRLDVAAQDFKNKKYEPAAISAWDLMNDPKMAPSALEAQYVLAKSLYRMGMYHASLGEFSAILSRGPETRFFQPSLEWLFFISHKTANESVILDEIAKYSNFEFPEKFRSEFHYLLARYYFVRGRALDLVGRHPEATKSLADAKRIATAFDRKDPFYARAKYLEGLAEFRDIPLPSARPQTEVELKSAQASLDDMKEVVRATRPALAVNEADARQFQALRELAFMQLARTHYGARQNRYAIYYYGKVERGDPQWLEALFESAWANYRVGQYEQSLGNLITLSSPFFRDEYFPEALILKAVIYYENCRYRESNSILTEFERLYAPVHSELERLLSKEMNVDEYYTVLAAIEKKKEAKTSTNSDRILERVLKLALTDKDLKNTDDSIHELEQELDAFNGRSENFRLSNLTSHLSDGLKKQRQVLIGKAGIMTKGKLQVELAELTKLLGNAERIRFETVGKEKEFLEQQLAEGGKAEIVKKYSYSVAVADDQLYWPYEGEYWRDELGTYQYTLTKGCIVRPTGMVGGGGP